MQTPSSDENSVCPSVRLSACAFVKRVLCAKIEVRSVQIFISHERPFNLVFGEEELLGGATLLPEILGQLTPVERNRRFSADIRP